MVFPPRPPICSRMRRHASDSHPAIIKVIAGPLEVTRYSRKHPQQRTAANLKRQDERLSVVIGIDSWHSSPGDSECALVEGRLCEHGGWQGKSRKVKFR